MSGRLWLHGLLLLSLASPAVTQQHRPNPQRTQALLQRRSLAEDGQEIRRYFGRHRVVMPPGLIRRDPLPPGVVDQLVRGETLPFGLEGEIQPLPRELDVRLHALDVALQRGYIDGRVITWERRTRRVVDVVEVPQALGVKPPL